MNILVVCHDYKRHDRLTLVLGEDVTDYIILTQNNIHNISDLTYGAIAKIAFIDTDESTIIDDYQYNNWDDVTDKFDFFFKVFCPIYAEIHQHIDKLTETGKIININRVPGSTLKSEYIPRNDSDYIDFFPLIVSPFSPTHERDFGPHFYHLVTYHVNSGTHEGWRDDPDDPKKKRPTFIKFNPLFIPSIDDGKITLPPMDESGRIIVPIKGGKKRKSDKTKKAKKAKKAKKINKTKKVKK
jgi:hypothetical protein